MARKLQVLPLWHYTTRIHMLAILDTEEVRPTSVGIDPGERPAVWFSACQIWEVSAAKGIEDPATGAVHTGTMRELHKIAGLWRIGVHPDSAPIDWETFKRTSGVTPSTARGMATVGKPSLWFAAYHPVPLAEWLAVETWDGSRWVRAA